jgi:Ricin-type beta-trefoil lectin domain-like
MKKIILLFVLSFLCFWLIAQETAIIDSYVVKIGQPFMPRSGTYFIKSAIADKSLDVKGGVNDNGISLHLWDFHKGDAQQFIIEPSNEKSFFYIKTKWGRALDISGINPNSEATLHTWDFHGGDNQKWQFLQAKGRGYFTIKSKLGTCVEVRGGDSASGAVIWMYKSLDNEAQKWRLNKLN